MQFSSIWRIIDSNIVLYILQGNANGERLDEILHPFFQRGNVCMSIISVAELKSIAKYNKWGTRRLTELQQFVNECTVFDVFTDDIVDAYIEIYCAGLRCGRKMKQNDLLIAATAKANNLKLLTADKDFDWIPKELADVDILTI